jgi:GTPase SAR1 family protein
MLSIERVKELLNDPKLSDKEVEEIRDGFYQLAELMFEQWQAERIKAKAEQKENVPGDENNQTNVPNSEIWRELAPQANAKDQRIQEPKGQEL